MIWSLRAARAKESRKDGDGSVDEQPKTPKTPWYRRPKLLAILGLAAIVAIVVSVLAYIHFTTYESTDDAFIQAHVVQISPKVAGYVQKLAVQDNQHVNKGDLLVQIDPRDFQAKLAEANANLDAAKFKLNEAKSNVQVLASNVDAAKADPCRGAGAGGVSRGHKPSAMSRCRTAPRRKPKRAAPKPRRKAADANVVCREEQDRRLRVATGQRQGPGEDRRGPGRRR